MPCRPCPERDVAKHGHHVNETSVDMQFDTTINDESTIPLKEPVRMKNAHLALILIVVSSTIALAQSKLGGNTTQKDSTALLELESSTRGMLLPRLTADQRDAIQAPAHALLVYNTTENCLNIYNATVGEWQSLCGDVASGTAEYAVDCSSLLVSGSYSTGVELNPEENTITIRVDVVTPGTYAIVGQTNGMFFTAAGVFAEGGSQEITLGGQGYPQIAGTNVVLLRIGSALCRTVITVANGLAVVTACGTVGTLSGDVYANELIADGAVIMSYTAGPTYTGGDVFGLTSTVNNGIRISSPVNGQSGTGRASAVTCGGALAGTYQVGRLCDATNTKVITLTVTTTGTFYVRTNTANGMYFEGSATLTAGTRTMTLTAVGTPQEATATTYTVTVSQSATAFVTCTFSVTPTLPTVIPDLKALACGTFSMGATGGVNYIKAPNSAATDFFGTYQSASLTDRIGRAVSIASDGLTMAIGAPLEDGDLTGGNINSTNNDNWKDAGAVYVYVRTNLTSNWTFQAKLKPTQLGAEDLFGHALELSSDGNTLVVGSLKEDGSGTGVNPAHNNSVTDAGAAYVFVRNAGVWTQQAYLKPNNAASVNEWFGANVAISGDGNTVAIGVHREDGSVGGINPVHNNSMTNSGAVHVFTRTAGVWSHQAVVKASSPGTEDRFGISVALSDDGSTLAVGAEFEDGSGMGVDPAVNNNAANAGAAFVFRRTAGTWSQEAYIKCINIPRNDDNFGRSVDLSRDGNTLIVGAPMEDGSGRGVNPGANRSSKNSGAAYTYTRVGSTWSNGVYLKPPQNSPEDWFGRCVAISGDGAVLLVGAQGDDANTTCVNGANNNSLSLAGGAYMFHNVTGTWISTFKFSRVTGMLNGDGLLFGIAVALDENGRTVVAGTGFEDGGATGINGALSNTKNNSGCVVTWTKN